MLHTVTERVNGIAVVRTGSVFYTRTMSIRPRARNLRTRYNEVYSGAFDPAKPANAHQVAADAVVLVAEAVLNARLAAYVEAKALPVAAPAAKPTKPARRTRDRASAQALANLVQQAGR